MRQADRCNQPVGMNIVFVAVSVSEWTAFEEASTRSHSRLRRGARHRLAGASLRKFLFSLACGAHEILRPEQKIAE